MGSGVTDMMVNRKQNEALRRAGPRSAHEHIVTLGKRMQDVDALTIPDGRVCADMQYSVTIQNSMMQRTREVREKCIRTKVDLLVLFTCFSCRWTQHMQQVRMRVYQIRSTVKHGHGRLCVL